MHTIKVEYGVARRGADNNKIIYLGWVKEFRTTKS
jgi:hypothetical protein